MQAFLVKQIIIYITARIGRKWYDKASTIDGLEAFYGWI